MWASLSSFICFLFSQQKLQVQIVLSGNYALLMQTITSQNEEEICKCPAMPAETHDGTRLMHESFDPNALERYSRPWFAWANTLFATLLEKLMDENFSPCSR